MQTNRSTRRAIQTAEELQSFVLHQRLLGSRLSSQRLWNHSIFLWRVVLGRSACAESIPSISPTLLHSYSQEPARVATEHPKGERAPPWRALSHRVRA